MPHALQVLKESFGLFLALGVGIFAVRQLNLFYRLIFAQVVWYVLVYAGSYAITIYQSMSGAELNNQWLYNLYFPVECALLSMAGIIFFQNRQATLRITIAYFIFLTAFLWQLASMDFRGFANYGVVAEAALLVVIYLMILYSKFITSDFHWRSSPEFWLCIGIAMYFACIVPYFSMINLLNRTNGQLNQFLFYLINEVLGNVRYLFTAVSFWLFVRRPSIAARTYEQ